jgi:hypothetical protein
VYSPKFKGRHKQEGVGVVVTEGDKAGVVLHACLDMAGLLSGQNDYPPTNANWRALLRAISHAPITADAFASSSLITPRSRWRLNKRLSMLGVYHVEERAVSCSYDPGSDMRNA